MKLSRERILWISFAVVAVIGIVVKKPELDAEARVKAEAKRQKKEQRQNELEVERVAQAHRKIATEKARADEERAEQEQLNKNQETCLSIYHSLEQSIQNGGVMAAAQYSHNIKSQVPIRGVNEGCFEIQGVVMSLGDIWRTGEVPPPAEFERISHQLVRAKALLNDPNLKRASFNTF